MHGLISTWPRRLILTFVALVLAFVAGVIWLRYVNDSHPTNTLTDADIMKYVLTIPGLLAFAVLTLTTAWSSSANAAAAATPEAAPTQAAAMPATPFKAQVVGIQWLNPLVRRDYPTEWQLLWTLGLAKPNKNDDMVKEDPKSFSSVQPVASIVSNQFGRVTFPRFFGGYIRETLRPLSRRYAMNGDYFYTVQPEDPKRWREVAGMRIEFAIPTSTMLLPERAAQVVREQMDGYFRFSDVPKLSTKNTPPDVHITAGGASAGFASLTAALDYLQANPDKTVWVMNWDAPDFPKDEQMSENCTLLVLAGPNYDTQREPLAWIGRPAQTHAKDFETKPASSKIHQAWEAALTQAATQAGTTLGEVAYVIHDAGKGEEMGKRIGPFAQALTTTHAELSLMAHSFNTPNLLGDMRAGTAVTNMALAIAWSHQKGQPVLVAGTTEVDDPVAVVITPPSRARIVNPDKNWFRARGEGNAYLPWWGLHKDYDWSKYMQGFSD